MNIAILYIGTGEYSIFWDDFYKSSEKYFLTGKKKQYFVFTDDKRIVNSENVSTFFRECQGFPSDSLFRFAMFWTIREELMKFDYIFFFNANMLFVDFVGEEILPTGCQSKLVALIHPGYYNKHKRFLPYERNKKSLAYIPNKKMNYKYYQGCLNGGRSDEYIKLITNCMINTQSDFDRGIVARVHDESHLNSYLFNRDILELSPSYGYPENWNIPFSKKIIQRDKSKYIPGIKQKSFLKKWKDRFNRLMRILFWQN